VHDGRVTAYLGVDLAWGLGSDRKPANETGLVATTADGTITDAGWARGVDAVTAWIAERLGPRTLVAVDASLVVTNPSGIREAERQVGQRYGRWKVAANPTNLASAASAGARLLDRLTALGVGYVSSTEAMRDRTGPAVFECYPYTTLVGVEELAYDVERPRYKRLDQTIPAAVARQRRADAFDDLVHRLRTTPLDPPLLLDSHPLTAGLAEPSGLHGPTHKHREDLLDGALCAWTAAYWERHGDGRVQILGGDAPHRHGPDAAGASPGNRRRGPSLPSDPPDEAGRRPVIVAPTRPSQRRPAG
jgi:predicted RNase H-like nuclease